MFHSSLDTQNLTQALSYHLLNKWIRMSEGRVQDPVFSEVPPDDQITNHFHKHWSLRILDLEERLAII